VVALAVLAAAATISPPRPRRGRRRGLNPVDRARPKAVCEARPCSFGQDGFAHVLLELYPDERAIWRALDYLGYVTDGINGVDSTEGRQAVLSFQLDWNQWAGEADLRSCELHGWIDACTFEAIHQAIALQRASDLSWVDLVAEAIDRKRPEVI